MKRSFKPVSLVLTMLLGLQLCLPSAAIFAAEPSGVYFKDYNDGIVSGWATGKGTAATFTADSGAVKAVTTGAVILVDQESPQFANGEYEVKLKFNEVPSRFGLVYRYVDSNNYNVIQYDAGSWGWDALKNGAETYGNIASTDSPTFAAGQQYTFKLRYEGDGVQLWIDGNSILTASLPSLSTTGGKIGLRSWFNNKNFTIDDLKVTEVVVDTVTPKPITITDTLVSDQLTVEIDKEFPRVKKYSWNNTGAEMKGQLNGFNEIKVNGKSYYPAASSFVKTAASSTKGETAAYTLQLPAIQVNLGVELQLEANILHFNIVDIEENGTEKVKTIEFPNHDLVSVLATEPKAQETAVTATGGWNIINEEYIDLKTGATDASGGRTYAFLNNDQLAATLVTNVVNANDKVRVKVATDASLSTKKAALSSGGWTYRGSNVLDPEPLPWAKVVLTPDANNDSVVDWQDGAIAYRQNSEAPYGSDMIRDNISYISMNIGSTTSTPFLRAFDNAKKISNLTDGFGQIVLYKGYQAEGHDDSHPDYGGHIGVRQGGVEDFNYVLSEGKKYNIRGGVHINATEYMLDAYETKNENLNQPLSKGWGWLDQAYYVNKTKDLESGELKRRLDMLKADTGDNLSFVYVDVYEGADYNAKKLAQYINDNGWMLGTEFAGPLFEQAAWVHWGTDPGYPNQGNSSKIIRFLRNDVVDGFLSTPLLKGNKQVGVGYWQSSTLFSSYKETTAAFFNQNLPTKYMQHFPIIKMTDNRVDFENNVVVQRGQDGKIHLSKDGKEIAIMTDSSSISNSTVFIPWSPESEDKIYHWNPAGGSTTWSLPDSWADVTTAQLYKLTDLGRVHVGSVLVSNGQVSITAEQGIGYALYKTTAPDAEEMVWGDGGPAKDAGFDSQSFDVWKKSSTANSTNHVQFVKNNNADDLLQVKGPSDATIEQVITGLEPGKTYSASVWVNVDGERKVEIGVKQGDAEVVNYLEDTKHPYLSQQHKYFNTSYQRIKVSFDAVSSTATLYLKAAEGTSTVLFDDVRVWENPTKTDAGESIFYEDFENVDEGWGPFVYSKTGPVRTHLAEKGGNQIKTYVLGGNWSLKTNEEGTGEWLRTLPQTLRMKEDNLYHLTMKYNSDEQDMYTAAIRVNENGVVRDLASQKLNVGENTLDLAFATEGAKDAYLAIIKNTVNNAKELTGTLILDDIRVDDEGPIVPVEGVLVASVTLTPQTLDLNKGQTAQINALVAPSNAFDRTLEWSSDHPEIASVDATGKVSTHLTGSATITATTKDESEISANVTVNVHGPNVLIPQSQMTAAASSFQPGDEASHAIDGDPSTMWHTVWSPAHLPESITLNLGGSYSVNQLNYSPRTAGTNGIITKYNLYASTDGVNFSLVTNGTWSGDSKLKTVRFSATTATHIRLEATAGVGNFAAAAEINVYRALDDSELTAVTGVQLDKTAVTLKAGETAELIATVNPENALNKNVTWSSSNEAVVSVVVQDDHVIVSGLTAGTSDITVTTAEGSFTATSRITVEEADGELLPLTKLSAPSQVVSEAAFTVKLGLNHVQGIYAQDIEVQYDQNVMDFTDASSLIPGVKIVESVSSPAGKLRFLIVSEGAANGITGNAEVLELHFKAKKVTEPVTGMIRVTKADIANAQGVETAAAFSTLSIELISSGIPGDMNNDGKVSIGDLAIIAAHYGKSQSSPDWQQVKKADIDGDGEIGLSDLAVVARKIVE
ncbi:MAG: endo-alpha-N-acetylgalactosaminidase family protein [Candidatus Pristimantibacillus sp.]